MTKPLTIEIDEAAADQLARIANDLGETPEQFAARAVAARIDSFESNVFFARRAKGVDREAAIAWLKELRERSGAPEPDADDRLPEGYVPTR
jgi:predicted transcriptional regulator